MIPILLCFSLPPHQGVQFNNLCLPFSTQYPCVILNVFLFSSHYSLPSFAPYLPYLPSSPTVDPHSSSALRLSDKGKDLKSAWLCFFPLFPPKSPNYRIFYLSSAGGISDWAGVRREIFAVCDLSGFLRLIIPHWAQLWHCGGWQKSSDSCCWASADPGESLSFVGFFPLIHSCSRSLCFSFWPFTVIWLTFFKFFFR